MEDTMSRKGGSVRHTDTHGNEATLLLAGQAQTPALPAQMQMKTSPVVPLHIYQTVWGYGEPLPGDELNLEFGMCSIWQGTYTPDKQSPAVSKYARLLDDTLQTVLTEHTVPSANTEAPS